MELLRKNWIRPLIERALRNSIDNPQTGTIGGLQRNEIIEPGYQESSNFRIPVRSKRYGQLIKCSISGNVLIGTLSDSFTSIECRFSRDFIRKYEAKHNVKIDEGSKGAIFKLLQFEILVKAGIDTALFIKEFEMHGCEGSQQIGSPRDIDESETVSELIREFSRARGEEFEDDEPDDSDDDSDISVQSQPESNAVDTSEPYRPHTFQTISQEACQTQVPNNEAALTPGSEAILTPKPRPKSNATDLLKKLEVSKGPAEESPKPDTGGSVLGEKATQPYETTAPIMQEGPKQRPANLLAPRKVPDINTRTPGRPLWSSSHDKHVSTSTSLIGKGQYRERNGSLVPMSVTGGRKDNFTASFTSQQPQASVSDTHRFHGNPGYDDVLPRENTQRRSIWGDIQEIDRNDIYIPKDQREMIDNPDSWVPPEAGKQMAQAHVPVDLLREWNEHAAMRRNKRATPSVRQETPVSPVEQQTPSPSSSSSSSGTRVTDWSLSPSQRVALPADSSPPQRPTGSRITGHFNDSPMNFTDQERLETQLPVDDDGDAQHVVPRNTNGALTLPPVNIPAIMGENSSDSEIETSIPTGFGQYPSPIESSNMASSAPIPEHNHRTQASPSLIAVSSSSQGPPPSETIEVPRSDNSRRVKQPQIPSDALVPGTYENLHVASQSPQATRTENLQDQMDLDDNDMVTRQLNSELDSCAFSNHAPGQQDPFKAGLTRSQNTVRTTQEGLVEVPVTSIETGGPYIVASAVAGPNKRKRDDSSSQRPTKLQKAIEQTLNHEIIAISSPEKERMPLDVGTRLSFFAAEKTTSAGQAIYDNFKDAYPEYSGDIKTFKRGCRTLQELSDQGDLPRTVLWDDFIFRESAEYPTYIMECFRRQESPMSYKTYFIQNVTSARLKKRNLSAKKVTTVVDDDTIDDMDPESQVTNDYIPSLGISQNSAPQATPDVASEPFIKATESVAGEISENSQESQVQDKQQFPLSPWSNHTPLETQEVPAYDGTSKDTDNSDDSEWHECDDTHEIASVDLGDDSRVTFEDNDVDMEDQGSVSSVDEAKYAAAATTAEDSAVTRSFSFHEVTEIEESDIDDTFRSAELDTSPKLARHASKMPRGYDETPNHSEKAKGKQKSPGIGESEPLYPRQPAPQREEMVSREGAGSRPKTKPWWKYANTPFKLFARSFTAMTNEGEDIPPPEVDKDGVIRPHNRGPGDGRRRGRLSTIGCGF